MTEKESSTIKNESDNLNDKFDEQVYLIHNYNEFVKKNESTKYENFVPLTGQPSILISKLLGTGISEMFNIQPYQLSLLQPKIKLFKTLYTENSKPVDVELIFNDFYREGTIDDILKSTGQGGFGVGLKSFEWEDMGTNPGDTGVAFKSTLVLHVQSLYDLFQEQRDKLTGQISSFADLIRVPPKQFNNFGDYNDKYFRIKIQLGWQLPTDNANIIDSKLKKCIEASTITLFLTLTDHDINLNQDRSATITANYIGAIEGKMYSPESDVLYVSKQQNKEIDIQEKLLQSAKIRKDKLKEINDKKGRSFFSFNKTDDELLEDSLQQEIDERLAIKENINRENKAFSYKRFLTELEKNGKIYFIDLNKTEILNFQKIRSDLSNVDPNNLEKIRSQRLNKHRLESKNTKINIQSYSSTDPQSPIGKKGISSDIENIVKQKDERSKEKALDELNKKINQSKESKNHNITRINFIYLGDIVNTALSIISKNQKEDNFRFLLGPIELEDVETKQNVIKNLADIPISLDLFNAWFLKKIIRPQLDKYLLRDFIRDICSELVVKALNSDPIGPYTKSAENRISFSVFNLGSDNDIFSSQGQFGNVRLNLNDLEQKENQLIKMRSSNVDSIKSYFMIYVSGHSPRTLNGNYEEDNKKGIYHLYFGADRGIVKNINFSKTDMQYLKEARIVNQTNVKNGDVFFVEPYNAKVDLWGTSVFKPGMMIYIDPKSIGMPKSIPKNKRIPLGGYYTIIKVFGKIESGKFETNIELNWESSGEEAENSSLSQTPIKNNQVFIDSPERI